MPKTTHEIVYEQAVRAVEQQFQQLDELRSRTAVILATSGVLTGFLGRVAIEKGLGAWGYCALAAFTVSSIACLFVLWPRWEAWSFSINARKLIPYYLDEAEPEPAESLLKYLAGAIHDDFEENTTPLHRLYGGFVLAAAALVVEILLWFAAVL
jgi:hypothetical protein